jgi:hypothetical protein
VTSLKLARKLTSKFHSLLADKESPDTTELQRKKVEAEIAAMGGREAYQAASALATQNYRSSRFVFKSLVRLGLQPKSGEDPLRILEIGAVNSQLRVCPWMRVRAIDLLSRDRGVETKDFFTVPIGSGPTGSELNTSSYSSSMAPTGAAALALDTIIVPAPSRLRYIDWNKNKALEKVANNEEGDGVQVKRVKGDKEGSKKRKRVEDDNDDIDNEDRVEKGQKKEMIDRIRHRQQTFGGNAAATITTTTTRESSPSPITGGYDVVVNAMVINCVMDPEKRAEMLIRCRDHLVPGGLFFLALPSRCLDVSENITRDLWEALLAAIGFSFIDEKRTAKISFYLLRRSDILASLPSSLLTSSSNLQRDIEKKGSSTSEIKSKSKEVLASSGYGKDWKPIIIVHNKGAENVLQRLCPPVKLLPKSEMPVTGFTKTKFSLSVPKEWCLKKEVM